MISEQLNGPCTNMLVGRFRIHEGRPRELRFVGVMKDQRSVILKSWLPVRHNLESLTIRSSDWLLSVELRCLSDNLNDDYWDEIRSCSKVNKFSYWWISSCWAIIPCISRCGQEIIYYDVTVILLQVKKIIFSILNHLICIF